MDASLRLADRIERAATGPMWHGPALLELLRDVSPDDAAARPVPGAHSIWELVLHVRAWADVARARLDGRSLGSLEPEDDWPPAPEPTAGAWRAAVDALGDSHRALARRVRALADASLGEPVPTSGTPYTIADLLHGVVEHGTYHGGQIAILARALRTQPLAPR